jgi:hypothetical protein
MSTSASHPVDPKAARLLADFSGADERYQRAIAAAEGTPDDSTERSILRQGQAELEAAQLAMDEYSLPPWLLS